MAHQGNTATHVGSFRAVQAQRLADFEVSLKINLISQWETLD
jgi:hypothetical protein